MSENKSPVQDLNFSDITKRIIKMGSEAYTPEYRYELIHNILLDMHLASTENAMCEIHKNPAADGFKQRCREMRCRSGKVNSDSRLVSFLYTLIRDHVTPGKLEKIVDDLEGQGPGMNTKFTNGYLANYAIDMAERLV